MGILAAIFCWVPILNWIFAILAVVFGLIGCFGPKKLKGLAIIGVILAVAAICVYKFYYVPKYTNAIKEVITGIDEQKINDAIEALGDAVEEAAEAAPAE